MKNYENDSVAIENKESDGDLYSINQIIELYPILSKHIITNAINDGKLKVTWIGHKRYFKLDDIEEYLKTKQEKNNNNISDKIRGWRNG